MQVYFIQHLSLLFIFKANFTSYGWTTPKLLPRDDSSIYRCVWGEPRQAQRRLKEEKYRSYCTERAWGHWVRTVLRPVFSEELCTPSRSRFSKKLRFFFFRSIWNQPVWKWIMGSNFAVRLLVKTQSLSVWRKLFIWEPFTGQLDVPPSSPLVPNFGYLLSVTSEQRGEMQVSFSAVLLLWHLFKLIYTQFCIPTVLLLGG